MGNPILLWSLRSVHRLESFKPSHSWIGDWMFAWYWLKETKRRRTSSSTTTSSSSNIGHYTSHDNWSQHINQPKFSALENNDVDRGTPALHTTTRRSVNSEATRCCNSSIDSGEVMSQDTAKTASKRFGKTKTVLVGGWTTHLKNIRQIGNLPQVVVKIKNVWNHHLVYQSY